MRIAALPLTFLGLTAWSLSSIAAADWDTGACPAGGSAPCIETEINGNTYHFNGTGGHADIWHGRPAAEGGGDFVFEGDSVEFACGIDFACTMALSGQVQKCQDSTGTWRIGVKVTGADFNAGDYVCDLYNLGSLPWYSKESDIAAHCPFEDDCDSFIPYDASASTYTGNFGSIDVSAFGISLVSQEHIHDVVFTPGVGANFYFNSDFYDCDGEAGCSIEGTLTVNNATSLDIQ